MDETPIRLQKGRYLARMACGAGDIEAAQRLRFAAFRAQDPAQEGRDADPFDAKCDHVLIEDQVTSRLAACFRMMPLADGSHLARSYSAQFYDLSALARFDGKMVEMGRFCIAPDLMDPDILRLAWGAMTAYVDAHGVAMLFGCTSFQGTQARAYYDSFALLRDRHLAPAHWRPAIKAPRVFRFAARLRRKPDLKRALAQMPPLLRSYLMMGGWVSDHAVIDGDLGTLHVFTGLEIAAVPPARARALRLVAS